MQPKTESPPAMSGACSYPRGVFRHATQAQLTHEGNEYLGETLGPCFLPTQRSREHHIGLGEENSDNSGIPKSYLCTL